MGKDIMDANKRISEGNHRKLIQNGVKTVDIMGAIGSGKTLLIEKLIEIFRTRGIISAAIVGDVAGDDDYKRLKDHDLEVININTGKDCHLDAHMISHALEKLEREEKKFSQIVANFLEAQGKKISREIVRQIKKTPPL